MKPAEAKTWMRGQLTKHRIPHPPGHGRTVGNQVTVEQVMKWREQVSGGRASELATRTAEEVFQDALKWSDGTIEGAKDQATLLIETARRMIP